MTREKAPCVLVVEDSTTQSAAIRFLLEDAGFEVRTAADGLEALDLLAKARPDVVATDLEMPRMNGLQLVEAIRRDHPAVPVVLITAHGSEEIAALALRKGAASYVPKVYLEDDLVPTLEGILAVTRSNLHRQRALECLTFSESCFVLDNDTSLVTPLLGHLDELLSRLTLWDATDRMRVGVALHETLLNAIYHGNLEVSSDLRQQGEEAYHAQIEERRCQTPYRTRRVHVRARLSPEEVVYVVRDGGRGFDPGSLPDPTDPANLERVGGRGLLLIRTFMDAVTHNGSGNEITLVKRRA
jgi:CheY-like chemotaxis protein